MNMRREEPSGAELRAQAAQRLAALGEMTGGIAHDFRNILAVIESSLRLAENSPADPEKMRMFIAGAREGVDRGLKLTSQLLSFARQREFKPRVWNANELLRSIELLLRYGAGPEVRLIFQLAPDIPECLIDPPQFSTAVLNLVVNARDAMPNGGDVQISTEQWEVKATDSAAPAPGMYVRVRVKDTGRGMPVEMQSKIFDPLFTTKGEKGTGLGLSQVYTFMKMMHGHVSFASEVGHGTTFDLLFPSSHP
jgi:signal transduction histidine kinase